MTETSSHASLSPPAAYARMMHRQLSTRASTADSESMSPRSVQVARRVAELSHDLIDLSHEIHGQPELAFQERFASRTAGELVRRHGFPVNIHTWGLPTAFRASVGRQGPVVAILAEYDALPGIGHGCGHNVICAAAIGAFIAAAPLVDALGGRLRLIGTPAEEGGAGKELIARAGGFDDVDAAMMVHPAGADVAQPAFAGLRQVRVRFRGLAAHAAAAPYMGRNALDGLVTAYQGIAQLRQHMLPTDRIHGIITNGGQAAGIVPDCAEGCFYLRSREVDTLIALSERTSDIFRGAAEITGTLVETEWDYEPLMLPVRHNPSLAHRYAVNMIDRDRQVDLSADIPSGSTDMGNISVRVPSIHPKIAVAPSEIPIHSEAFASHARSSDADRAVLDGAVALARTALDYLATDNLRTEVARQFEAAGGRVDVADLASALR